MRIQIDTGAGAQDGTAAALHTALDRLEASGAGRFDPVRFRYIQAMAKRSLQQDTTVATLVLEKAWLALQAYQSHLSTQRTEVSSVLERVAAQHPEMAEQLQGLFEAFEFKAIKQLAQRWRKPGTSTTIASLIQQLQIAAHDTDGLPESSSQELKSVRYFRDALQQQYADKLVTRALTEAPESAGPLNPQKLALRSLAIMREVSPAYLGHFVSYVETLFWLERFDATSSAK